MTEASAHPLSDRSNELFNEQLADVHGRTSRIFAWLMGAQWIAAVVSALLVSPQTWIGRDDWVNEHVWLALVLGGLLSFGAGGLALQFPTRGFTRQVVAVAQMLYSALLIHLTGGRIETHFHIFGSLAFLAFYRDRRVLLTATLVMIADQVLRGMFAPVSMFGTEATHTWRWLEHAGWVVFEDVVLFAYCDQGLREIRRMATDRAALEFSHHAMEVEVRARTAELVSTAAALRVSEAATRVAKEAADAAHRAKSEFLTTMSHEIRTRMTAVIGYAELLMSSSQGPDERLQSATVIKRNGGQLLQAVNDVLDLSKTEAGNMTVEAVDCSPVQIAEDVVAFLSPRALAKGVSLKVEQVGTIPFLRSDATRIKQVIMNLVSNAVKFTDQGQVIVRLSLLKPSNPLRKGSHRLRIEVRDTGVGMTPDEVARLFQPLRPTAGAFTQGFRRTGLGLLISHKLVKLLGGEILVESTPGKGSTFAVVIEAPEGSDPKVHTAQNATPALVGRILMAEDSPDSQRLISTHLKRAGAQVEIVSNGVLAIEAVRRSRLENKPIDLILMDMQMPEMDGYTAASKLRQIGWAGPIIALTANAMKGDRERCLDAGCDDYLSKPAEKQVLIDVCSRWMSSESVLGNRAA